MVYYMDHIYKGDSMIFKVFECTRMPLVYRNSPGFDNKWTKYSHFLYSKLSPMTHKTIPTCDFFYQDISLSFKVKKNFQS